jgi:hypothetical protein
VKVGMALTAHKTVTMFMRYVHSEDDPIRAAADVVALRRKSVIAVVPTRRAAPGPEQAIVGEVPVVQRGSRIKPRGFDDRKYASRTKLGNYRPFRHRKGENRSAPPGTMYNATDDDHG